MRTHLHVERGLHLGVKPMLIAVAILASAAVSAQESPAYVTPSDGRQGTFKAVVGDVTLVRADVRRAAVVGGAFTSADRLVTGPESAASMTLQDGTVLAVGPDSAVNLDEFVYNSTTQEGNIAVRLMRGTLRMVTGLIARLTPENVSVRTATSVIGVRGTDFIVEAQ